MRTFASAVNWRRILVQSALDFIAELRLNVPPVTGELRGEAAADYLAALVPIAEQMIVSYHRGI